MFKELIPLKPGIDLIKEFEKLYLEAYPDPLYGWTIPTIGYGMTEYPNDQKVKRGDIITAEQAEEGLLLLIEKKYLPSLEKIYFWHVMNCNQQSALLSFAWNIGANFYGTKKHESITELCDSPGRWNEEEWIKSQFVKYRNPGSKVERGLKRRREREAELFCNPCG